MKKVLVLFVLMALTAFAHAPLLSIDDNQDGTLYIVGGFSNGASAGGVEILFVEDRNYSGSEESFEGKRVLFKTALGSDGTLDEVPKPRVLNYLIVMNAGPGHVVSRKGPRLNRNEISSWKNFIEDLVAESNVYVEKLRGN